jgi:hypothetical protein
MLYVAVQRVESKKLEQSILNLETEILGSDDPLRVSRRLVGVAAMTLSQLRTSTIDLDENMFGV